MLDFFTKGCVELEWAKDSFKLLNEEKGCEFPLERVSLGTHQGKKLMIVQIESITDSLLLRSKVGKGAQLQFPFQPNAKRLPIGENWVIKNDPTCNC